MANARIDELYNCYLLGKLNSEEVKEFLSLIEKEEEFLKDSIFQLLKDKSFQDLAAEERGKMIYENVSQKIELVEKPKAKIISLERFAVAAAIFLLVVSGVFLITNQGRRKELAKDSASSSFKHDIAPGKDGAVLTLYNGKQIVLDNAADGNVSGVAVKNGNVLTYSNDGSPALEYNTVTTPKGRQYALVLSDGSRVWLNAASSIRFPVAFSGQQRSVEITGEAYFEVVHDAARPFHVMINGTDIQVLGTHFNVNGYSDEPAINTTLLEGRVKVSSHGKTVFLNPGQQAIVDDNATTGIRINPGVNTDEVIAWKNGKFQFGEATDLHSVMRQLARWYDVDIVFNGDINTKIGGTISRSSNVSEVLNMLQMTGAVTFRVEGRKIIVLQGS